MNNKPKTKLLTISLLCCGRAETTERCLKSLMPIREAIDSEIQVVDTGCSPETRAIVDKYADEVFEFSWVNDFAAARNFQLDQANGKMFLFIDDDEFFLDCKYIIEFFKQPDCTKYNIGGYFQRNYLDKEGAEWEDIEVVRMCSVTPKTYFVGKVHEYIEPAYGNAMFMDARAGHFGYVYQTIEDSIKHSMRNIPLLEEMMDEMPDNLRWPYQLAQEYRACQYYDKLYELCRKSFDYSFNIREEESIRYRGPFAAGICIGLYNLKRYDELLDFYRDQIKKDDIMIIPKARISLYAAHVMFIRGMDEECVETANFYLKVLNKEGRDRGQMFVQGGIFINDTFDELHTNSMYCYLMTCGMRHDDYGPLTHYYRRITWNSKVVRITRGFVMTLIDKSASLGYKREINDVLNKFFVRPGFRDILQKEIDDSCNYFELEQIENIKAAFKGTDRNKEMDLFMDIRILEHELQQENLGFAPVISGTEQYVKLVLEWDKLHREWMEEKADPNMKYSETELAIRLRDFLEKCENDPMASLTTLKNAIGIRKSMDTYIQHLSRKYSDYIKLMDIKDSDPAKFEEMYHLEEALLNQIADLDAAGKEKEALATYKQLVDIMQTSFGLDTLHI